MYSCLSRNHHLAEHAEQATFPANAFTGSGTLSGGFNSEGSSLDFNYFVTQYSYDGLGDLLQVTQKGDPSVTSSSEWRVRNFTYDSLGRLLTAVNPGTMPLSNYPKIYRIVGWWGE